MEPSAGAAGDDLHHERPNQNKRTRGANSRPRVDPDDRETQEEGRRKMMEEYEAGAAALLDLQAREREMMKLVPASTSAVALLRSPRAGETRERHCPVCLDDFEEEDELKAMPCAHSFHRRCIFRLLSVNRVCPVCGYELPGDEDHLLWLGGDGDGAGEA